MAYDGHDDTDDDYHQLGMFHMINGVNVKVGEKYKLPERISLPVAWKPPDPSALLTFQYDFWKENEVIRCAEEERLVLEAQMRNSAESNDVPTPEEPLQDTIAEEEEEEENADSSNTSAESNTSEILTPLVIPSEGVENKLDETTQKINVSEFEEDKNQNPFELVELQTLDEYDELRSVLEPTAKSKKTNVKANVEAKTSDDFELDTNFFNKIDIAAPVPSFGSEGYTPGNAETEVSKPLDGEPDAFNLPCHMSKGTLNWTKFHTLRRGATEQSSNVQSMNQYSHTVTYTQNNNNGQPFVVATDVNVSQLPNSIANGPTPVTMPCEVSCRYNSEYMPYTYTNPSITSPISETAVSKCLQTTSNDNIGMNNNLSYGQLLFMTDEIPRTKSLPELQGNTDQISNPSTGVVSSNNYYPPDQALQLRLNMERSQDDNVVSTDRIDSIMKQYQFQRLNNNLPAVTNYNPPNNVPAVTNYNPATCGQFSNVCGNKPPQYVGLPGFTPDSVPLSSNNIPSKKLSNPLPLPFDAGTGIRTTAAGTGIRTTAYNEPNLNLNPMNSNPSPHLQSKQFNMLNQPPTSNFQMQAGAHNAPQMDASISTGYPTNNPFMNTSVAGQNSTQVPTSIYRHGILPPLPMERSHLADNFTPVPPSLQDPTFSISTSSQLTPLTVSNQYTHETDLRGSQTPSLPSISPRETPYPPAPVHNTTPQAQDTPPYPPVSTHQNKNGMTTPPVQVKQENLSWLVDPTEDLLSHEKNFAYQIAAMGFPLPCVSRTIQRVGVDQKEVLDFLCSVEDLKEKDYHNDDVEMALVNVKMEKDKVMAYLQMVATFRELGFKPLQIHNALRETTVDQNKALDYLTSSR